MDLEEGAVPPEDLEFELVVFVAFELRVLDRLLAELTGREEEVVVFQLIGSQLEVEGVESVVVLVGCNLMSAPLHSHPHRRHHWRWDQYNGLAVSAVDTAELKNTDFVASEVEEVVHTVDVVASVVETAAVVHTPVPEIDHRMLLHTSLQLPVVVDIVEIDPVAVRTDSKEEEGVEAAGMLAD